MRRRFLQQLNGCRALGAVAVTVPSCWYLLQNGPEKSHGHGDHGDAHGKEHGDDHEEEESQDESKDEDKDSKKSDDSDSGDEGKDADTPDTSDDEGEKDDKSKDSKAGDGKPKEDKTKDNAKSKDGNSENNKSDTPKAPSGDKKTIPDSKGANKIRTDSEKGQKQGKLEETTEKDREDAPADKVLPKIWLDSWTP